MKLLSFNDYQRFCQCCCHFIGQWRQKDSSAKNVAPLFISCVSLNWMIYNTNGKMRSSMLLVSWTASAKGRLNKNNRSHLPRLAIVVHDGPFRVLFIDWCFGEEGETVQRHPGTFVLKVWLTPKTLYFPFCPGFHINPAFPRLIQKMHQTNLPHHSSLPPFRIMS